MKKIIFLMPFFQTGGIERTLVNVVRSLQKDYTIQVIIRDKPAQCRLFDQLIKTGVSVEILSEIIAIPPKPKKFFAKTLWKIKYKRKKRHLEQYQADTIDQFCSDADLLVDFFSCSMKNIVAKIKSSVEKWAWFHCSINAAVEHNRFDCLKQYDKVIGLTDIFCTELRKLYPDCAVYHLNNPINIREILATSCEQADFSLENIPYFVSVARLSVDKDIETLIKAYNLFRQKTSSTTKLYLVGKGNNEKVIHGLVEDFGLKNHVIFCGEQANPYPFMKHAKACILSSKSEASPCVLIEAMICDTLPVCADCPTGPRELLDNGKRGVLFPVEDYKKLAEILIRIDQGELTKEQYAPFWKEYIDTLSLEAFGSKYFPKILNEPVH